MTKTSYLLVKDKVLCDKTSLKLDENAEILSAINKEDLGYKNIEIIFDNNFVSFGATIEQMQILRRDNLAFKIRPKNHRYTW